MTHRTEFDTLGSDVEAHLRALLSCLQTATPDDIEVVRSLVLDDILLAAGRGFGVETPVYELLRSMMALVTASARGA